MLSSSKCSSSGSADISRFNPEADLPREGAHCRDGGVQSGADALLQKYQRTNQNDANQSDEQGVLDHPRTAFVFG